MQNAKMQSVDIVIVSGFCLCIFCKKGEKRGVLMGCFRIEMPQKATKPTSLRWVFVLVHQVFDVDSHAEDGAGVDKYLAEEHQHRAVYLACGRKCQ